MDLPVEFEIVITTEHFKRATSYIDPSTCPLAEAVKERFPGYDVTISWGSVRLSNDGKQSWIWYRYNGELWNGGTLLNDVSIETNIKRLTDPKLMEDFPNYTVPVTKFLCKVLHIQG
jgi:hypothetical protein